MHRPRSVLLNRKSPLEILEFGCGKNIFVWRQIEEFSHRAAHFSRVNCLASALTAQVGSGRKGSGPSDCCDDACFASMSASSLP